MVRRWLRILGVAIVVLSLALEGALLVVGDPGELPGPLGRLAEQKVVPWLQDHLLPPAYALGFVPGDPTATRRATALPTVETPSVAPTATPTATATAVPTHVPTPTRSPMPLPPTPTPTAVPGPVRLVAGSIGLDAPIVPVGVSPAGEMGTPQTPETVGWYGPKPGQPGNALLAGHVDWLGSQGPVRGAFFLLRLLRPGDEVVVRTTAGDSLTFQVEWKEFFDADSAPVERIAGPTTTPSITLITCGGNYDRTLHTYSGRWVVHATLVR